MQLQYEPKKERFRKIFFLESIFHHNNSVREAAKAFGISLATAYRWRHRWLRQKQEGFGDRRYGPRSHMK